MEILTPADYQSGNRKRPRRSGRPCDACRRRKTRCVLANDGGRGCKCVHCQLRGSSCTFEHDPPGRIPSGSAVGGDDPDHHPRAVQMGEEQMSASEVPSQPSPRENAPRENENAELAVRHTVVDEGRGTAASTSAMSVCEFAPGNLTLGLAPTRFSELYGLGSDMEPILMVCVPALLSIAASVSPIDRLRSATGRTTH